MRKRPQKQASKKWQFLAKALTAPMLLVGAYIWWETNWQVSGMLSVASLFYFLMAQKDLQDLSGPYRTFTEADRRRILDKRIMEPRPTCVSNSCSPDSTHKRR